MNTLAEKRICIPREDGMPEGATIPRDPPFFTGRRKRIWIAVGGIVAGYLLAILIPLYDYRTGPGMAVTRIHRVTGEIAFCSAVSPCMTVNERVAWMEENERVQAAVDARLDASAADATALATDTAASGDATVMTEDGGRDLFEEVGIKASDAAQ